MDLTNLPTHTTYEGKSTSAPTWSDHQHAIFEELVSGSSSLVIHAVAGSGKTTTLIEIGKRIPRGKSTVALAFNKAMGETLQAKMPYWIQSKTFHSHCYEALKASLSKPPRVDFKKVGNAFKVLAPNDKIFYRHVSSITKLVGYAKSSGLGTSGEAVEGGVVALEPATYPDRMPDGFYAKKAKDMDEWQQWADLIDYFDVDTEDANELILYAQLTLNASNEDITKVDFDDMLYLTLLRNVPFQRADFLLVDEAQDLNGVQRELLGRMIKTYECPSKIAWPNDHHECPDCYNTGEIFSGRLIAVGDPHQAIYGFRGADADGMEKITEAFGAKVLPLSVSYRCSHAVIAEANKVLNSNQQT